MTTSSLEKEHLKRIDQAVKRLVSENPESLVRREELGSSFDFEESRRDIERTQKLFKNLQDLSLADLPSGPLGTIAEVAENTQNIFDELKKFSVTIQDAPQKRKQPVKRLAENYESSLTRLTPYMAYCSSVRLDFERHLREARESMEETQKSAIKTMEDYEKEAQQTIESLHRAAGKGGVSRHSTHFEEEADDHKRAAKWWLLATIGVGAVAIVIAIWSYAQYKASPIGDIAHTIQLAVAKGFIFSILYFILVTFTRSYRAHRHNCVVNRHRQIALNTFEAFVKAAEADATTKNAVLLRATETIFSPAVSGYLAKEREHSASSQITEIVRGYADKSQSPES